MSQISTAADGMKATRRRGNTRATVRYRCAPATIGRLYVGDDHEFQHAWVLNLSQTGIGFILMRPIAVETPVVIQMRGNEPGAVLELAGTVVHCTCQLTGDWLVGCEFVHPVPVAVLDNLL